MSNKQRSEAAASSKGTVYQLCVGVQKCYEMTEGQSVLIEREGDISIDGEEQVEVKHYSDFLTDSHLNFWNTLTNWLTEEFNETKYSALILHTTQDYGSTTMLKQWNESSAHQRITILEKILDAAEERFMQVKQKKPDANVPKSLRLQRQALVSEKRGKLESVVSRCFIETVTDRLPETHKWICDTYIKGIENRAEFLDSLIGFVSHAEAPEDTEWEITYDDFDAQVAELMRIFKKDSYAFPRKHFDQGHSVSSGVVDQHLAFRFVEKIVEIDHYDAVRDAIRDYLGAVQSLNEDFKSHHVSKRLEDYIDDLVSLFVIRHRAECRRQDASNLAAQNFFDAFTSEESRDFTGFERPHRGFKNGLLHTQIDDASKALKWKLEKK